MMKIFVCYARLDRIVCQKFVKTIDHYDVFYDDRIKVGDEWWKHIKSRLDWCDVFVFMISAYSINSHYCLKELEIALQLEKKIIPILIEKDVEPPKSIAKFQYGDLTKGFDPDIVKPVLNSLYGLEQELKTNPPNNPKITDFGSFQPPYPMQEDPVSLINQIAKAMDQQDFEHTLKLIDLLRTKNKDWEFMRDLEQQALAGIQAQEQDRDMKLEYRMIYELYLAPNMRPLAIKSFLEFNKRHPDYDPQNIMETARPSNRPIFPSQVGSSPSGNSTGKTTTETSQGENNSNQIIAKKSTQELKFKLPMLEFLPIHTPAGLKPFQISKYPITNEQFNMFIQDPKGAKSKRWWSFSTFAMNYYEKSPILKSTTTDLTHPRTNLSWYDAMAFSYWLGDSIERRILLPSQIQWRRAAQGSDGRAYTWGKNFNPDHCNCYESNKKSTTSVDTYPQGMSPYGVIDMIGNVWEWCLDGLQAKPYDHKSDAKRVIMGGCYRTKGVHLRLDQEYSHDASYPYIMIGFRVVALT
jgi:formylglycine-generating enzyme required for sulfatase activity